MKSMSGAIPAALALSLLSSSALAYSNGNTGYSGKSGSNCTTCHQVGAAVPTVTISGPTSLEAGATGQYTLIIKGGPAVKAGADIAVSNTAAALKPGTGLQALNGELTHTAPKDFSAGEARFDFSLVAPASAGTVTLYAAGNSVNFDKNNTGDGVATTKLDVTVTGAAATTPTPTEEETKHGCSTTGGGPLWLLSLGLGVLGLRRSPRAQR